MMDGKGFFVGVVVLCLLGCAARGAVEPPQSFEDPAQAIKHYETLLEKDPSNGQLHQYLAEVLWRTGDTEEAEAHYRRAIDEDSALTRAYVELGRLLEERGQFAAAAEVYRHMRDNDPLVVKVIEKVTMLEDGAREAERIVAEGQQMLERGRYDVARLLFRRAIGVAPFYLQGRVGMAEALAGVGGSSRSYAERTRHFEEGLAEYDQVLLEEAGLAGASDGRERIAELLASERRRYSRAEQQVSAGDSPFRMRLNADLDLPRISLQNRGDGDAAFELAFVTGPEQSFVAVGRANVHENPTASSDVVGSLSRGAVVFPLGEERGFTFVTDGDLEGWIASELLESDVHLSLRLSGYTAREIVVAPGRATCRCSRLGRTIWEGDALFLPYVSYTWSCE
jgi:tetratricopeptide (TPR) repeat protein